MKYKVQLAQLTSYIVRATPVMWKQQMVFYALLQSEWLSNCLRAVYSVKLYVKKEDTLKCLQLWRQNNRVIIFFILVWALGWLMSQVQTAFSQANHLPFWATLLSSDKTKHKLEERVSESHNGILTRSLLRANFLWWEWVNPNFEFVHPFPWTSLCLHKISVSSLLTAVKNQVTGNFILNEKSEDAKSKTFIENGLQWEYSIEGERETLKTTGPLHEGIIVLVSVSSKFSELPFVLPNFCLF